MTPIELVVDAALASPGLAGALALGPAWASGQPRHQRIVVGLIVGAAALGGPAPAAFLVAALCGEALIRWAEDDRVGPVALLAGLAAVLAFTTSEAGGLSGRTPLGLGVVVAGAAGLLGLAGGTCAGLFARRPAAGLALAAAALLCGLARGRAGLHDLVLIGAVLGSSALAQRARSPGLRVGITPALGVLGALHLAWLALASPSPSPYAHPPALRVRDAAMLDVVVGDAAFVSSLACLPDGRVVFGELASGRLWQLDGGRSDPGVPRAFGRVPLPRLGGSRPSYELGLWGLAAAPDEPFLYAMGVHRWDESASDPAARTSRIVRLRTDVDDPAVEPFADGLPAGPVHAGGVLRFGPDGALYASIGDGLRFGARGDLHPLESDREPLAGTVVRFVDGASTPELVASGLRNVYGLAFAPGGALYATENGADCCDALLAIRPGARFGWPPGESALRSPERPLWTSGAQRLGPTGIAFLSGKYGALAGDLVFATWHTGALHRVRLDVADQLIQHEIITAVPSAKPASDAPYAFAGAFSALDVCPDGTLWFSTLNAVGRVTAIRPP